MNNTFYVIRRSGRTSMTMHRLILGLQPGDGRETDHKNRNGLNNCRDNVRVCTRKENVLNRQIPFKNTKGCSWDNNKKRWRAYYYYQNRKIHIGDYNTEIEAHQASLNARKEN